MMAAFNDIWTACSHDQKQVISLEHPITAAAIILAGLLGATIGAIILGLARLIYPPLLMGLI